MLFCAYVKCIKEKRKIAQMTRIVKGIFIDCVDSEVNKKTIKKQQLESRLNCVLVFLDKM